MAGHDDRDDIRQAADSELLAELGALFATRDPVPANVLEAAHSSLDWRDVDSALAELLAGAPSPELAGVRSADDVRLLTFETPALTVELDVSGPPSPRRLRGMLVPPAEGELRIVHSSGAIVSPIGEDG